MIEEVKDIGDKLSFGFRELKDLFDYDEGLEFIVDTAASEGFARIEVKKEETLVYEDSIERPANYREIGQFIGRLLYSLVNPEVFEYIRMRERTFFSGLMDNQANVLSYVCDERIVMDIITLTCGKIIGEAANETYTFKRNVKGKKGDFEKRYELMEKIYNLKGNPMISELARLNGREGRIRILDICGTDITPSQEQ